MDVLLGVLGAAITGLLAWQVRETYRISRAVSRIQMALFGNGNVEDSVLPLVPTVAAIKRRMQCEVERRRIDDLERRMSKMEVQHGA